MSDYSICIADLAAYNNRILLGVWIDATQKLDNIHEAIQTMLATSRKPVVKTGQLTTMTALPARDLENMKALGMSMPSPSFWKSMVIVARRCCLTGGRH